MIREGVQGVEFIAANTDAQALSRNTTSTKLSLGKTGLGAGAKPEAGKAAADAHRDDIRASLEGSHMAFITAGMGGGTGTGAAPVVAEIAREMGILTVGVVTKPFSFEGGKRMKSAEAGIAEFAKHVDSLIVIPQRQVDGSDGRRRRRRTIASRRPTTCSRTPWAASPKSLPTPAW